MQESQAKVTLNMNLLYAEKVPSCALSDRSYRVRNIPDLVTVQQIFRVDYTNEIIFRANTMIYVRIWCFWVTGGIKCLKFTDFWGSFVSSIKRVSEE